MSESPNQQQPYHHPTKSFDLRFVSSAVAPVPSPSHGRKISIAKPLTPTAASSFCPPPEPSPAHSVSIATPIAHSRNNSVFAESSRFAFGAPPSPRGLEVPPYRPPSPPTQPPLLSERAPYPSLQFDQAKSSGDHNPLSLPSSPESPSKMQVYPVAQINPDGSQVMYDAQGNMHVVKPPPLPAYAVNGPEEPEKDVWTDPPASSSCSATFQLFGFVLMFVAFHLFLFGGGTTYWAIMPDTSHIGLVYACFLSWNSGDPYCNAISQGSCTFSVDGGPNAQLSNCSTFTLAQEGEAVALICSLLAWIIMGISMGAVSKIPRFIALFLGLAAAAGGLLCMIEFLSFVGSNSTGFSYSLGLAGWIVAFVGDVLYGFSLCT